MSAPLVLTLPLPPNMANSRWHWRVKENKRQAYFETLDILVAMRRLPAAPPETPRRATIGAAMVVGGLHDADNALARLKWACDWLVRRGYLHDDNPKCLTWDGLPTQEVSRKKPATVTLTITPLAGAEAA